MKFSYKNNTNIAVLWTSKLRELQSKEKRLDSDYGNNYAKSESGVSPHDHAHLSIFRHTQNGVRIQNPNCGCFKLWAVHGPKLPECEASCNSKAVFRCKN